MPCSMELFHSLRINGREYLPLGPDQVMISFFNLLLYFFGIHAYERFVAYRIVRIFAHILVCTREVQ